MTIDHKRINDLCKKDKCTSCPGGEADVEEYYCEKEQSQWQKLSRDV